MVRFITRLHNKATRTIRTLDTKSTIMQHEDRYRNRKMDAS